MGAEWRFRNYRASADKVADELKVLGDDFTPADVLELATNEDSELHKCFTWDNDIASQKWRLHEARMLITNLVYVEKKEKADVPTRLYYKTEKSYYSTPTILKTPSEHESLMSRARAELISYKKKYQMLEELNEIVKEVFE